MGDIVIKQAPDLDAYILWSTNVESPIACGNRAEMNAHLADYWNIRHPGETPPPLADPEARLRRADTTGTSAVGGFAFFGAWDYDSFVYEQRGLLRRRHLLRAAELVCDGRDAEVWDLLIPFEDRTEVRRG